MDFVVELLLQLVGQIVAELFGEYVMRRMIRRVSRVTINASTKRIAQYTFSGVAALAFGVAWGAHLSHSRHWPRLLWVSLAFALVAGVRARRRRYVATEPERTWRYLVTPPWRWSHDRLVGFVVINLAIAIGIGFGYGPGN